MSQSHYQQFTKIVSRLFLNMGFEVVDEDSIYRRPVMESYTPDLSLKKNEIIALAELKHYRNKHASVKLLRDAALQLLHFTHYLDVQRVIIVSNFVTPEIKESFLNKYGICVWDRNNLVNFIASTDDEVLFQDFQQLLLDGQQGTDTENPLDDVVGTDPNPESYFILNNKRVVEPIIIQEQGRKLFHEFSNIQLGKAGWAAFEVKCLEILKYLFADDLAVWEKQQTTDDDQSRFDLICRMLPLNDFWKSLIESFHSRYILFEFKNYSNPITHAEIFTTERYLYPKALRSIAIIIARNGATEKALSAAKGALREQGKLILLLSSDDLEAMLKIRDRANSAHDYLSDKLDEFLLSLSR